MGGAVLLQPHGEVVSFPTPARQDSNQPTVFPFSEEVSAVLDDPSYTGGNHSCPLFSLGIDLESVGEMLDRGFEPLSPP